MMYNISKQSESPPASPSVRALICSNSEPGSRQLIAKAFCSGEGAPRNVSNQIRLITAVDVETAAGLAMEDSCETSSFAFAHGVVGCRSGRSIVFTRRMMRGVRGVSAIVVQGELISRRGVACAHGIEVAHPSSIDAERHHRSHLCVTFAGGDCHFLPSFTTKAASTA